MSLGMLTIFGAGVLTFFTPCVLPLIPIYLTALTGGSITGLSGREKGRLLLRAALFSIGFIGVFTAMGFGASTIGGFLSENKTLMLAVGAILVLLFALKFIGLIQIPALDKVLRANDSKLSARFGAFSSLLMGVVFAAGWSPCVGPVLGSILTYTASTAANPVEGAGYLTIYGAGFALPLLVTAAFAELGLRVIGKVSPYLPKIEKLIGVILLFISVSMMLDIMPQPTPNNSFSAVNPHTSISNNAVTQTPQMVELYREDCGVCQRMKSIVDSITSQCSEKGVSVQTINIDLPENRHFIKKYKLVGVPTFLFLDKNGEETARLVGEQTESALKQAISVLRGQPCPGVSLLPPGEWEPNSPDKRNCNI